MNFDSDLNIRDLSYPRVGMENHVSGHFCRLGVWVDNHFSWIDDSWTKRVRYKANSLVTDVVLQNPALKLELRVEDGVHHFHDLLLRKIRVKNQADKTREVRLFFSHDLHISDTDKGITAYYDPKTDAVIHFKKDRYFAIGGHAGKDGLFQYAVGVTEFGGLSGTWKDAEDGELSMNSVAHGSVDSTISFKTQIREHDHQLVYSWILAGTTLENLERLHALVTKRTPQRLLHGAQAYFQAWVNKSEINFGNLPTKVLHMFKRSLLVLRTQIDNRGGIVASSDSDILRFNKDTYSYVWPRDGAFVAMGLDAAGYYGITQRFFHFCNQILSNEGFLYQKYHPDGSWGSTWHSWVGSNRDLQLPIQEDETALVLVALWKHYNQARDIEYINPLYEPLVCKAADFLVRYRDPETHLPLPSYDLWEENRGVSTFTTSAVYAGLQAASSFAYLYGDQEQGKTYHVAAKEVKDALLHYLYDKETGRLLRMIKPGRNGEFVNDSTIDSSVYGIFELAVLPADDPKVQKTMQAVESTLWVKTEVGGIARYENDYYHQVSGDVENVPGNPWIICTLWLGEWYIAKGELGKGLRLLEWVVDHASEAGLLPEQIHPYSNQPLSVSPLTWSHSTFVLTVIEYLHKLNEMNACKSCGLPIYRRRATLW